MVTTEAMLLCGHVAKKVTKSPSFVKTLAPEEGYQMNNRTSLFVVGTVLLLSAPAGAGDDKAAAPKKSPGNAIFVAADQVKWTDADIPGVKIAAVQGDPSKGASHFMLQYPAGFVSPEHHHSADHFVTVVSGTLVMTADGADSKMGPGSFFAFTKKKPHIAKCEGSAPCVMSIDARGKWDVVLPKAK
jgi:mannose-6-phosphate isomerase-like protein (cupin superfamily)